MDAICTGDVLLFSKIATQSKWVRFFTGSRYSHVAIAVRVSSLDFESASIVQTGGHLCVYDMNGDDHDFDIVTGTVHAGVRLIPFENRLSKGYDLVAYRKLLLTPIAIDEALSRVKPFIIEHKDAEFLKGFINKIRLLLADDLDESDGYACTMLTAKFISSVFDIPVYMSVLPTSFQQTETDAPGQRYIRQWYGPETIVYAVRQTLWQSCGWLLVITVILVIILLFV